MASPVGLAIRNEKAQQRINDALAQLAGFHKTEMPSQPVRSRDPLLREMLRMEWTADVLEQIVHSIAKEVVAEGETKARKSTSKKDG